MDIKIEWEHLSTICQGCLNPDRKISPLNAQDEVVFLKLRDEGKFHEGPEQVLLCWECKALLNKMKSFQSRIKRAQHLLVQCLQRFYNKENNLQTLSTLKSAHIHQYNLDLIYEDQPKINLVKKPPQNKEISQNNTETKIKQEIVIKEESVSNYETDNFEPNDEDTELKIENDIINKKPETQNSGPKSLNEYLKYATVTKSNNSFKNIAEFFEMAFLTERETEEVLKKDKILCRYPRMPEKCKTCNIGYITRLDLLRHKTFHHSQKLYPTTCLACKKKIPTESEMESHWKDFHSTVSRCTLCSELCVKKHMRRHLRRFHTKTFTCIDCLQEFRNLREFSVHYKKMHERVVCDYCDKMFSSKRKLENHIRQIHTPAHCKICDRSFIRYKSYWHHTKEFHPELLACDAPKELSYCVECDKQYPSIYRYKRHLQQSVKHRARKIIRVPCPECNKIFSKNSYMNNHYRLFHMKKSKHYCEICNKYFSNGYGVRKHIQIIHEKMTLPKDKICDICGRGFSTNRILTNHRRTHTGERPYQCKYCSATFAQETAMKSHQKTQHKKVIELQPS